jgi:hypothetical protein
VRTALLADPELSERQKQVLIEIYESFRRENGITADGGADAVDASPAALTGGAPGSEGDALTVAMEMGAEEEKYPDDGRERAGPHPDHTQPCLRLGSVILCSVTIPR